MVRMGDMGEAEVLSWQVAYYNQAVDRTVKVPTSDRQELEGD